MSTYNCKRHFQKIRAFAFGRRFFCLLAFAISLESFPQAAYSQSTTYTIDFTDGVVTVTGSITIDGDIVPELVPFEGWRIPSITAFSLNTSGALNSLRQPEPELNGSPYVSGGASDIVAFPEVDQNLSKTETILIWTPSTDGVLTFIEGDRALQLNAFQGSWQANVSNESGSPGSPYNTLPPIAGPVVLADSIAATNFVLSRFFDTNLPGFGFSVALDGDFAVIGGINSTGGAALLNIQSGQIVQIFDNPNPSPADFFSENVDVDGGRVLISAPAEDFAAPDGGAAYLFDSNTGNLLQTFTHPDPPNAQSFGRGSVIDGNYALMGAFRDGAFLFDTATGGLLQTFPDLNPNPGSLALADQFAAVGDVTDSTGATSAGAVQLFDPIGGQNLQTFFNPTPSAFDFFGDAVAVNGSRVLIGAGQVDTAGIPNAGEAYLFDATAGSLLQTFVDPTPNQDALFGRALDIEGDIVAIGSQGDNEVHIFNAVSGNLVQTLSEQPPFGGFGRSLDLDQANLLVGAPDGGAYLYTMSQNEAPSANAGIDQAVRIGDTVFLDGTASFDDNTPTGSLEYDWSFTLLPVSSNTMLMNADTTTPSFFVDVAGTYSVQLVVTDEAGLNSLPDDVIISSDNLAPTADAGLDQLVVTGSAVSLDGTGSTDPESDPLTYSWTITIAPQGSAAGLNGADTPSPYLVVDVEGTYQVTLVVSDQIGPGIPDSVVITATSPEQFAEIQIVSSGETIVQLQPSQVTTEGNQNALTNFLRQATAAIAADDLTKAINKLQQALSRTDGCELRGAPDDKGPGRDWITECTAQNTVYSALNSALEALTP